MKKVLAIAFIGGLVMASCSKKADHSLQDSNTMLPEPEAQVVPADSTKVETVTAPAIADSTAAK